jgi:antitoxin component YwqK of YwqJK toxin-antitoxin module
VKHGTETNYNLNGKVACKTTWRCGKKHGKEEAWHDNGQRAREETYTNGKLNDVRTEWRDDGRVLATTHFVDGLAHGPADGWFYKNGIRHYRLNYVEGKQSGLAMAWLENEDGRPTSGPVIIENKEE